MAESSFQKSGTHPLRKRSRGHEAAQLFSAPYSQNTPECGSGIGTLQDAQVLRPNPGPGQTFRLEVLDATEGRPVLGAWRTPPPQPLRAREVWRGG